MLTFALFLLLFAAGCDRMDSTPYALEADEPGYKRGRELLRQGRNRDALSEFNEVLAKRGLNKSPETHLEMALLYQQHMRDPLSALYHFKKYLELKPNAEHADLVRQRIEVAKREYASTLPGRPSIDSSSPNFDYAETIRRLQDENDHLRSALNSALAASGMTSASAAQTVQQTSSNPSAPIISSAPVIPASTDPLMPVPAGSATSPAQSSYAANPISPASSAATQTQAPQRAQATPSTTPSSVRSQPQPAATQTATRKHVVGKGESLSSIARQYYGTATNAQVDSIVNANRDILQSRNTSLRVGMELKIP